MNNKKTITIEVPEGYETYDEYNYYDTGGDNKAVGFHASLRKENHINEKLLEQINSDKIKFPDFWKDLYIVESSVYGNVSMNSFNDDIVDHEKVIEQPHRENIIKWHSCSEEDKKKWQWQYKEDGSKWFDIDKSIAWSTNLNYRSKPKMCSVTLNDGTVLEYPEPLKLFSEGMEGYWFVWMSCGDFEVDYNELNIASAVHKKILINNACHATKEAAKQHAAVLNAINNQKAV
jgi:hypothetical protein